MQRIALFLLACACSAPPPRASQTPQPTAPAGPAQATPARAFRIDNAKDLLDGPMAAGAIGDYRLENDRVVAIVDALARPGGFQRSGGHIRDLAPRGGRDEIRQVFLYLHDQFPRQVTYTRARLVEEGGAAELRVSGQDDQAPALAIETAYRVEPGRSYVKLTTVARNRGDEAVDYSIGDGVYWGTMEHFAPGQTSRFHGALDLPWVGGIGDGASVVYATPSGAPRGRHATAYGNMNACVGRIGPGDSMECVRYLIVGARPDLACVFADLWALRGQPAGMLGGRFVDASSLAPVARARVAVATDDGKPFGTAITDEDGAYEIALPPGAYRVSAAAPGRSGPVDARVAVEQARKTTLGGVMTEPAEAAFELVDGDAGAPIAAKITILGIAPTPDPRLGPTHRASGAENVVLTATGRGKVALPSGRYKLVASHGPEWSIASADVDLAPARSAPVRLEIRRVVPTAGYIAADLHQHAAPSTDSAVTLDDRVVSDLAEGVEVAVATDHEAITSYDAAIERLGVRGKLLAIPGDEATTSSWGHWNGFPMTWRPDLPRGGAPSSDGKTTAEIVAALRADPANRVVQLNHPRVERIGYMGIAKFDPADPKLPDGMVTSFDAMEVANGKRMDTLDATLRDWYSLLKRGLRVTATGNSDTHRITVDEAGWPRNYVGVPDDDPAKVGVDAIVAGIKERRDVVVSTGPFLRVRGGSPGRPPGASVRSRGGLDLEVEVWAAPWIDVTKMEIVVNGEVAQEVAVPPSAEPKRLAWKGRVPMKADGFVVVIARGEKPSWPVIDTILPVAIANPIWVDADAKAGFRPPGIPPKPKEAPEPATKPVPAPATKPVPAPATKPVPAPAR